jgi:hypothetical protein
MSVPSLLRPMHEFDPWLPSLVHDRQNGRAFRWSPKWAAGYERRARQAGEGVVVFDGFVLDGWLEPTEGQTS